MLEGGLYGDVLLYGDKEFVGCSPRILTFFREEDAGEKAQGFASRLNSVRIMIEWGFGKVVNTF